jgi:hypothetical protein
MSSTFLRLLVLAALLLPSLANAEAVRDRFSAGGYFRIMTRPDMQGGDGKLGYWNLYGRLLNEGPWGTLALKLDLLQNASRGDPWASVVTQIEGGSFHNTDSNLGKLGAFGVTRLYIEAGNLLAENLSFQLGTLEQRFGDLGLYDMWPAEIFWDTVGVAARYDVERFQVLVGVGDAGFQTRGSNYSTILSAGGMARLRFAGHLEIGVGGQYRHEPEVQGNRNAPYTTPGVAYQDYLRREVVKSWLQENPGQELLFPNPEASSSDSYKLIGYLGFGGFGPLRWNNLFANFLRLHPKNFYTESYGGRDYTVFVKGLTDERYQVNLGNEMQVGLIRDRLDATWSMIAGYHWDDDNALSASDDNRFFFSTVLRLQAYLTQTVHLLAESSLAQEQSLQGNLYREHFDSVFHNSEGIPDSRGFEYGDTDTRNTWQFKGGLVLNPRGPGIFTRPSLRLLYGLQYSNQNQAYGNAFSDSLDQYNIFSGTESHWHSVVAIEAEAWF